MEGEYIGHYNTEVHADFRFRHYGPAVSIQVDIFSTNF